MEKADKLKYLILLLPSFGYLLSFLGSKLPVWVIMMSFFSSSANILFLTIVLLFNTIDIIKTTNNNYLYLCRMKDNNNYFHLLIKNCLKSNFKIILISIMLNIAVSFICSSGNLSIPNNPYYSFNYLFLLGYYTIKYILVYSIIPLGIIFFYSLSQKIGSFIYILFITICGFFNYSLPGNKAIDSILKFPVFFPSYITVQEYSPFILDIIALAFYLSIFILFYSILKHICIKNRKDILS